ncbi:nicotinate phosphoribosyltransferase [Thaumasiovibrio subtropicus]|uniref:nicotinate phosphoribosyltransferase n=1 Tax=Thaumasiovibrio subtropicus TaxID=1891207 RepID=UPI000B350DB4|nr:nicotinate phosphoribosyltransferase [Thaumasiovibrio subtropicus]
MNTQLFQDTIIQSILDLDVYKINMMNAAHCLYPDTQVRYELIVRSDEDLTELLPEIRQEIMLLDRYHFTDDQIQYLEAKSPYLSKSFLESLRYFRFFPQRQIELGIGQQHSKQPQLTITIQGSWKDTILYETLIMSIVSEVRNRRRWGQIPVEQFRKVLVEKVKMIKHAIAERGITNFKFAEMGTRRRFSASVQRDVLDYLQHEIPNLLVGTSNYHLAREMNLTPIGTVAHEWFMAHQAMVNVRDSQRVALNRWNEVFAGKLGVALSDTIGLDAFLNDFDIRLAKAFSGVRHDSGCPFRWGDRMIAHYQELGIDPLSKTLVFTDGLDFNQALDICEYFKDRIDISFGIGTFLANDMGGWESSEGAVYRPLSMVIKMVACNDSPVAKISDEPEKAMCEDVFFLLNLKQRFGIPIDLDNTIKQLQAMQQIS